MFALAVKLPAPLDRWWRETNSHASSVRGTQAYGKQQYAPATQAFTRAHQLAPSAQTAFNLGTSQVAAGQREQGSATLTEAIKDPALRADALFNRGNSALAAKSLDAAIGDYIAALKARPNHPGAKRNLEIALAKRESARHGASAAQKQNQPGKDQQKQQQAPSQGQKPQEGQPDLDALLRSVQQQEQEELRRMKAKASAEGKVGW